jgi:hypothetical protein
MMFLAGSARASPYNGASLFFSAGDTCLRCSKKPEYQTLALVRLAGVFCLESRASAGVSKVCLTNAQHFGPRATVQLN